MYKKITIKCITNCYNYDLKVMDVNKSLINYKVVNKDEYEFLGLNNCIYIIEIKVLNHTFFGVIRVSEDSLILFDLNKYINSLQNITFLLTDKFYPNLKIKKGELVLWQNLIQ